MTRAGASEATYNLGTPDYSLACELDEWATEQAAEADVRADRWEREGRAEMYAMLELSDY